MLPYIVTFTLSTVLLLFAEKSQYSIVRRVFIIVGILLPTLLAGFRADTIGTDVLVYGKSSYLDAVNSTGFSNFFSTRVTSVLSDPAYYFITYLLSLVVKDYHLGFFVYSLITCGFMYFALKRCKKMYNTPIWFGMLLFYLTIYNYSLNLMRQCIAISILFYAWTYLANKQYKMYALFNIIAILFHSSAIIGLVILPVYLLLRENRNKKTSTKIIQGGIVVVGIVVLLAVSTTLIDSLVGFGLLRDNYLNYLTGGSFAGNNGVDYVTLLQYVITIIFGILLYRKLKNKNIECMFLIMCIGFLLLTKFGTMISTYISRIGYYFMPFQILLLCNTFKAFNKKSQIIWGTIIIGITFFFWWYTFVFKGYNATVPYLFY